MTELLEAIASWQAFLAVLLLFGFAPGFVLRCLVLIYPREDPRRTELVATLYSLSRVERPLWVAEQLETVLFDGLPHRVVAAWRKTRTHQRRRRRVEVLRKQIVHERVGLPARDYRVFPRVHQALVIDQAIAAVSAANRVLVVGDPATGKTTGAKILLGTLLDAATRDSLIPIFANLVRWNPLTTSLSEFLISELSWRCNISTKLATGLIKNDTRLLAVLDGFDEIPYALRHHASRALETQWAHRPLLLTSRPSGLDDLVVDSYPTVIRMEGPRFGLA